MLVTWNAISGTKAEFSEVGGMGNLLLSSVNKDFLLSLETPSPTYLKKKKKSEREKEVGWAAGWFSPLRVSLWIMRFRP